MLVACNGHAIAAGTFPALAADLRIGVEGPYKLGLNEVKIGLTVPLYVVELARQRLTPRDFNRALVTATMYGPAEAVDGRPPRPGRAGRRSCARRASRRPRSSPGSTWTPTRRPSCGSATAPCEALREAIDTELAAPGERRVVNVLIAADMEGIAGIEDYGECLPSHPAAYARGRRLMTDEVLAVVEALRAGGVEGISVGDWHMVGTNIERERMPEGVEVRPIADLALNEADPSFTKAAGGGGLDAVVLIGHHAKTPSPRGFSSHTFIWEMEVELDGDSLSETQVFAQGLAAEGIPILAAVRRPLAARGARRRRARQRPLGPDQGGRGAGQGDLARSRRGAREAGRGGRRGAGRGAAAAPAPRLPGRAARRRLRRGDREDHSRRLRRAARRGGDDLQGEPGLTRVPPARGAAAVRPRLAAQGDPSPPRQPAGDAGDPLQGEALARLLRPAGRGRSEREDVRPLRLDPPLEHVEPGVLHRVEALAVDRLQPAVDPLAERVPGVGDAGLEAGAAPVLGALGDAVGREEEGRAPARAARPRPPPISSQWVAPTAMLWTRSSPKCEWTAWRTSPSPETST